MAWLRLTIESDKNFVEPLSELLEKFGASSVSYAPATDEALYDEPSEKAGFWQHTAVSALLDHDIDLDILLACIRNLLGTENIFSHKIESLADREWLEAHKEGHGPMLFGDRLCVCPSWSEVPAGYQYSIMLDPGLAFGTGAHATTSLCLQWLAENELAHKQVIDYGCGSGILALAAARLGADKVYAVDIDPQAISATRRNADNNGLQEKLILSQADQAVLPEADILVANILLKPLLGLASKFSELVQPDGQIILSGILATQVEECLATYDRWFTIQEPTFKEEWAILHGYR